MKYLSLLAVSAALFCACGQLKENNEQKNEQSNTQNNEQSHSIRIGVIDSLFSEILNEQRKVWIYLPASEADANYAQTKYPVLYLLDGDAHFFSVVGMIQQLSQVNGNTICPEMIVVGIPNTDRTRDLTPTHVKEVFGDTLFAQSSGGGENFTRFIADELIPYVDKHYPSTSHRTLIGHSFGGLFTINTLLKHPELFTNYIAIDPSLWWDQEKLSRESVQILAEQKFDHKSLYVAVANTMKEGMELADLAFDTSAATAHIRSILRFSETTQAKPNNGLNFEWKYYQEDDHGSIPLIASYDALRSMYGWYRLKGLDEFFDPDSKASTEELVAKITSHYENASKHFGYLIRPPESLINSLGYGFLGIGKEDKAYAFFQMNVQNYPESANVYDSMGDYHLAQKDTVQAIEYFTQALTKADFSITKEKLKMLEASR